MLQKTVRYEGGDNPMAAAIRAMGLKPKTMLLISEAAATGFIRIDQMLQILPFRLTRNPSRLLTVTNWLLNLFHALEVVILPAAKRSGPGTTKSRDGKVAVRRKSKLDALITSLHEMVPTDDLLAVYLRDILQFRLLTTSEVKALGKEVKERGDEESRNKIVEHNLRLPFMVARRYRGRGLEYLDLIQEANIGLMRAADKYDYSLGHNFSTYAVWWLRQSVVRALYDYGQTIRIPIHNRELWNKIIFTSVQLVNKFGREPNAEEIAAELKQPLDKIRSAMRRMRMTTVSLSDLVSPDGDEGGLRRISTVKDRSFLDPSQIMEAREELEDACLGISDLLIKLSRLPDRTQDIFKARYGLNGTWEKQTLEEVAAPYELTRERVRQVIVDAWTDLRSFEFPEDEPWLYSELDRILDHIDLLGAEAEAIIAAIVPSLLVSE